MNLQQQIEVNELILRLIRSKHPDPAWSIFNTPEENYYRRLEADTIRANRLLATLEPQEPAL